MILPNRQRNQVWERTKFYNLFSKMDLYWRYLETETSWQLMERRDFSLCDLSMLRISGAGCAFWHEVCPICPLTNCLT